MVVARASEAGHGSIEFRGFWRLLVCECFAVGLVSSCASGLRARFFARARLHEGDHVLWRNWLEVSVASCRMTSRRFLGALVEEDWVPRKRNLRECGC